MVDFGHIKGIQPLCQRKKKKYHAYVFIMHYLAGGRQQSTVLDNLIVHAEREIEKDSTTHLQPPPHRNISGINCNQ